MAWRLPQNTRKPTSCDSARSIPSDFPRRWETDRLALSNITPSAASAPAARARDIRSSSSARGSGGEAALDMGGTGSDVRRWRAVYRSWWRARLIPNRLA